jgi:hypothetical protein
MHLWENRRWVGRAYRFIMGIAVIIIIIIIIV